MHSMEERDRNQPVECTKRLQFKFKPKNGIYTKNVSPKRVIIVVCSNPEWLIFDQAKNHGAL
jgi:hypothetical protein